MTKRHKSRAVARYKLGLPIYLDRSHKPKRIFWACLGVFILIVIIAVHFISTPAHGHRIAVDIKVQTTTPAKTPELPPASVNSSYFSLNTPPGYTVQQGPTTAGYLYDQNLIKPGAFGSLIVTITVKNLPAGGLSDDPDYTLRQSQPSLYQLTSQTIDHQTVSVANSQQQSDVVAFWPHGNYLATISVRTDISGQDANDNSEEVSTLNSLLLAFHWIV